jgi:hypothetical protein
MDTHPLSTADPADVQADLRAVIESLITQQPLDPVIARRVQERSERIRQEVFDRHGLLNVAVDLIRETRDTVL